LLPQQVDARYGALLAGERGSKLQRQDYV